MIERITDHLTYLSEYAASTTAFQHSEKVQKVRLVFCDTSFITIKLNTYIFQALVAAYRDLLDFYVKVRKLFTNNEGRQSCRFFRLYCTYQRLLLKCLAILPRCAKL